MQRQGWHQERLSQGWQIQMTFPTLMYRVPGARKGPSGTTYDYIGVQDQGQYDERLGQGWHPSLEAALGHEAIDETSPPTRDELEAKAKELGVRFNKRTSDAVLLQRIEDAI
jgi:hypothetical protein